MDSVTHGSVSVLIGLIFVQFYDVPIWLLLIVLFVFGILADYDHVFYYKKKNPEIKLWNLPQLIKVYFKSVDERDKFIYHTWIHEPFGVLVVSGLSWLIFGFTQYWYLGILASIVYAGHYLLDLLSGKMKPLSPFTDKVVIDLQILPANSFIIMSITLIAFLVGLIIYLV
ncbi:MAG: metal-dependent hydrolase [Candidatus Heimdallarchaeaceae archaeon]